ncbi:MAG: MFS transporter [Candidatus Methanoplasma sp.]|jgi:MFS family permease|nr:MFS transporter [Candidatus Methanoplasma sp.]
MESYLKSLPTEMKTLLAACCIGAAIMPLMSTMMNLALIDIGGQFSVGSKDLAMVSTIFLLGSVAAMVPLARISDIIGRRKIFITGLVITIVSAVIAAFSPHFYILLIMRFIMGAGSAAVGVTSVAILTEVFPFERRGWAIGIQTACIYVGSAIGPAFGGFICDLLGWREIFFIIIPFAAISLLLILRFKQEFITCADACMDYKGAILFSAMIMITMCGMVGLPDIWRGEMELQNLWAPVLIAIGMVLLYLFLKAMKVAKSPVLDTSVFKYKVFSRACLAAYLNYASSFAVSFFMALYLQSIGALSPMQAGLVIMIQPVIQVVLTARFGSKSDKIKDKRILPTLGMAITGIGVAMIMFLGTEVNFLYVGLLLAVLGVGYGVFAAPNTSAVMSSVPPKNRGAASGMIALVRQLGMMTSMSVAMCSISIIMGTADNLGPATFGSFVTVLHVAFGICLAMCIVGTIISWFRGNNPEGISEYK